MDKISVLTSQISNALPQFIVAAGETDGSNFWHSVAQSISSAIDSAMIFLWVIVAIALIGVGLACIIGSDRSKEMAKSKFVYIVIGCAVILGSAYLAKGITGAFQGAGNFTTALGG